MKLRFLITLSVLFFLAVSPKAQTPVIDQFLAMLDGTEKTAEAAVRKYCSDKVIQNGMIPYGSNPKITRREENCVLVTLTAEDGVNQYWICEVKGKITVFEYYFGEGDPE